MATVQAVLWSREGRIRRRSRIWRKQLLDKADICSVKLRWLSKMKPRLRAEVDGKTEVLEVSDSDG